MDSPLINVTPMSATEARECTNAIKGNLESLRLMLLELYRRKGWLALEYANWEDCAVAEFGKSRAYTFRLLAAAQVEENLADAVESTIVDLDDIPVSHLTELAKLPLEQQAQGLLKAEQIAQEQGKKRNANHIAQAVQEIKQPLINAVEDTTMQQPPSEPKHSADAANESEPSDNVQNLSNEQIALVLQAIGQQSSKRDVLHSQPNTELKQMLKKAKQIIKNVKLELNQRRYTNN
ncbi:MAG: hypothetical protein KME05_07790 [Gloeocapsa sp. UFS-A4-WI-NPMV-4B04]|jgi:hypothetical protein|nr:hypothetical protein [Gloeocapsa sp. UFS-A4-WI-NPMV-4B04]